MSEFYCQGETWLVLLFALNLFEGIFIYWNMYLHSLRIIMYP